VPGSYFAWISDGVTDPASRFNQISKPWSRLDGVIVADSWPDLTDGFIDVPIDLTETGSTLSAASVRSNVKTSGNTQSALANDHCNGWTSTTGFDERTGTAGETNFKWTDKLSGYDCTFGARLYCFQQ
jgi:hypothetical protein